MNKLMQLINAMICWSEVGKLDKKEKGLRGICNVMDSLIGEFMFFLILAFGIFKGWVHIPYYLGDGYSYDHFDRKEGDDPEYNYILSCNMDEWMSQVCRIPYWLSRREHNV